MSLLGGIAPIHCNIFGWNSTYSSQKIWGEQHLLTTIDFWGEQHLFIAIDSNVKQLHNLCMTLSSSSEIVACNVAIHSLLIFCSAFLPLTRSSSVCLVPERWTAVIIHTLCSHGYLVCQVGIHVSLGFYPSIYMQDSNTESEVHCEDV